MRRAYGWIGTDGAVALAVLWAGIPLAAFVLNPFWIGLAISTCLWIYLCTSWNVLGGTLGQISFGNAAFFGIGAYTSTYLGSAFGMSPWLGAPIGALLAAAAGFLVGFCPFRWNLGPLVFALITLAFGFGMQFAVSGVPALGETSGLFVTSTDRPAWDMRFHDPAWFLVTIGGLLSALLVGVQALSRSRLGYFWRAVHANDTAAAAAGIDRFGVKHAALAISAFSTALAGSFYAQQIGFIDPESVFGIEITVQILLFTVVGGAGTFAGPIIGPMLLVPLGEMLRLLLSGGSLVGVQHLVFGLALIVVILLCPDGIVGGLSRALRIMTTTTGSAPDAQAEPSDGLPWHEEQAGRTLIEVDGVAKHFGGVHALREVSLSVRSGEILGIIGPNGAGKTTLFLTLAGFQTPTRGRVTFRGNRIDRLEPHVICRLGIACTFQITRSFAALTVFDVVYTAALLRHRGAGARRSATAILGALGLWQRRSAIGLHLSLAEQRQLEIARALATEPAVLLLDEVMAGLTPLEVQHMMGLIRRIRDGETTVILIEHNVQAVMRLCDRIVVLDAGEAIADGVPAAISADPRVIEAYLGARDPACAPRRRTRAAARAAVP